VGKSVQLLPTRLDVKLMMQVIQGQITRG